ncbi:MAG: hypothetical protein GY847_25595 [Proteobacteria bacterium]|nr:hypothetical protein [Pseudomonadota bacterium]
MKMVWGLCLAVCLIGFVGLADKPSDQEKDPAPEEDTEPELKGDAGPEIDAGPETDAGDTEDAGPRDEEIEEVIEPSPPSTETVEGVDDSSFEDIEIPEDNPPFAKGINEAGLNFAMAGSGDYFYFGAVPQYAYYVIDRLAPGIQLWYTHIFLSRDYGYDEPHTLTILPFLKFVILRSRSVAPYIFVTAGYQFEWGSDNAVNAWTLGGGGGVHVGLTEHVFLNIQLLAQYYWYRNTKIYEYADNRVFKDKDGMKYVSDSAERRDDYENEDAWYGYRDRDGVIHNCAGSDDPECALYPLERCINEDDCIPPYNDQSDEKRELLFPLITFGVSVFF